MKKLVLKALLVSIVLLISCKKDYATQEYKNNNQELTSTNKVKNGYIYFEETDKNLGITSTRLQLPKQWKRSNKQNFTFEGSNNMRIGMVQMSPLYNFTQDQNMLTSFQMNSKPNQFPMSINQIVEQFFMPYANQTGKNLVNTYKLPNVSKKTKLFLELLYNTAPTEYHIESVALEWEDSNGMSFLTVLRLIISKTHNLNHWVYMNQHVEAPKQHYQEAKKIFIDAILSEQHNTDWVYKRNKKEAQKAQASYQAHQARMSALKLRNSNSGFTSSSSNAGDIYSEILDINHSGYLKNSNINSAGHTKTVNMIGERSVIGNHNTGEHYNVQSGSKYYWINNNGKYFGTDNSIYDPRIDKRINKTEWTQFKIEK